ncbi:MAG: hypothetical protein ACRERE_13545 [Candidatus Entotheonellia bacterium]
MKRRHLSQRLAIVQPSDGIKLVLRQPKPRQNTTDPRIRTTSVEAQKIVLSLSLYLTNSQNATVDDRRLNVSLTDDTRPVVEGLPSKPGSAGAKALADRSASPFTSIGVMPPRAEQAA